MIDLLKEMFNEMVIKKDASLISKYYHPEFLLYTNDQTMNYQEFLDLHVEYYATAIKYKIEYDDKTVD